jgi:UPF0176 protein
MSNYVVILFYKFTHIADPKAFVKSHQEKAKELGLLGRMLVAEEGVNATFEGTKENIEAYKEFLKNDLVLGDIKIKESEGNGKAFPKLKFKIRDEVVTLGKTFSNVKEKTAPEVTAEELQKMYANNEDFVVLDLRNDYEIACGKFEKTVDPGLSNFRDLPQKLEEIKNLKSKKVIAVCTGGIRCEKATCLLKEEGFENIYQLKDGIHTYMEQYPGEHFKGTLFVFDNRMTTDVVETENKDIIGRCHFCNIPTEEYYCDDSVRPSKKIICCKECFEQKGTHLRPSVAL